MSIMLAVLRSVCSAAGSSVMLAEAVHVLRSLPGVASRGSHGPAWQQERLTSREAMAHAYFAPVRQREGAH